jgi:hypothetical protein
VDLFKTLSPVITVIVLVCLAWPLTLPLLALAVKVRQGTAKSEYEPGEFWWRCALGSFGLAVIGLITTGILYGLISEMSFTDAAGVIDLTLLFLFIPAASGFLFWALALEDFFQALSVLGIFLLLPGLPLALLGWLFGWGKLLAAAVPWLLSP